MIDGPYCIVYIHGGRMKDFLISPCSVYIRTLVYIWQSIRYKNGSYLFCVRKLSNVWSLWVLKIILKICLVESPRLRVVQLQLSCPQNFYPNQVTKVKPTLSTPLNLSKTTSINFYRNLCTCSTLLYINIVQKWKWITKNGVVPIPLPRAATLESRINTLLRLLIFLTFFRGYGRIPEFIEPI